MKLQDIIEALEESYVPKMKGEYAKGYRDSINDIVSWLKIIKAHGYNDVEETTDQKSQRYIILHGDELVFAGWNEDIANFVLWNSPGVEECFRVYATKEAALDDTELLGFPEKDVIPYDS